MSRSLIERAKSFVVRLDRWVNARNGFGGSGDPVSRTEFGWSPRLTRDELTALFVNDWITRKCVERPARDATREWYEISHPDRPEDAERIRLALDKLDTRAMFQEAKTLSRLYGGALIIVGALDGSDFAEPLAIERVKAVNFLHVVDRFYAWPMRYYNDPLTMDFGKPEIYDIWIQQPVSSAHLTVHASRVLRFDGAFLPQFMKLRNNGWGADIVTAMYDALKTYGVSSQSAAAVMQDFISIIVQIGNFQELLAAGQTDIVENRLRTVASERSINNLVVTGADEKVEKMGTPISGMPELLDKFMSIVSAASGLPRSILFETEGGALASGGGAGASDLRNYYDSIRSDQTNYDAPRLKQLIDIVGASIGVDTSEMTVMPKSLWQMTDIEKAELRSKVAQTDAIYMQWGVVDEQEIRRSRFGDAGWKTDDVTLSEDGDAQTTEAT